MKFPVTRTQLAAAGSKFVFARPCKRCKAELEFHRTPTGALAPLQVVVMDGGAWMLDSHFKTCPFRDEFKKDAVPAKQKDLFE